MKTNWLVSKQMSLEICLHHGASRSGERVLSLRGEQDSAGVARQTSSVAPEFRDGLDSQIHRVLYKVKLRYSKRNAAYAAVALSLRSGRETARHAPALSLHTYVTSRTRVIANFR